MTKKKDLSNFDKNFYCEKPRSSHLQCSMTCGVFASSHGNFLFWGMEKSQINTTTEPVPEEDLLMQKAVRGVFCKVKPNGWATVTQIAKAGSNEYMLTYFEACYI